MNILALYNATQTYTNTVFEHIDSFQRYSRHRLFYCHSDPCTSVRPDFRRFDVVLIHYSIRLPYDQIPEDLATDLAKYQGLKILFIQDEYDHTYRAWQWINRLKIDVLFTVVPSEGIARVYPPEQFPQTRFVSNLTGYIPERLPSSSEFLPPSMRGLTMGYRARPLPLRYGQLGFDKVKIGQQVKEYCLQKNILHDIAWSEEQRIYGPAWYQFMGSCKSMLGTESGSNVFDWDGTLENKVHLFTKTNPHATAAEVYRETIRDLELPGLMNQVSPRIFEAIALRTVLVLYEGTYSGVVRGHEHYIPLRKDGSNLDEVFAKLNDGALLDAMTERAYADVIASGRFSYARFVGQVDDEIDAGLERLTERRRLAANQSIAGAPGGLVPTAGGSGVEFETPVVLTFKPVRALPAVSRSKVFSLIRTLAYILWAYMPKGLRGLLRPLIAKIRRRG